MKKLAIIASALFLSAGFLSSCEEGLLTISFDYKVVAANFEIDPTEDVGEFNFEEAISNINLDSVLEANGVDAKLLQGIYVKELIFTETNGGNFDAFVSARGIVLADGQDPIEMGFEPEIPEGATTFTISGDKVNDQVNVEELFKSENFKGKATFVTDAPIEEAMKVKFEVIFDVKAGK